MTDFNFYSETYCGSLIPADAWDAVCRDAEAQMNRYERIYHVSCANSYSASAMAHTAILRLPVCG